MKLPIFIHTIWDRWEKKFCYVVSSQDMSNYDYTLVRQIEIPFEEPTIAHLTILTVAALRDKKKKVLADQAIKIDLIDEEIATLLCLENKEAEDLK